ncbi:sulfotransferase [Roseiconus lacunae]|uniref:sulfotransferase family protein n=1 Tax=Roseiconus lacunae TaxID=2605694 RepID=UPI00308FD348|nr:sulfotransferase [Stieleria sp. HD01]
MTNSPIFVTGTQRSGTTLLCRILECSSQIWALNEIYPLHSLVFDQHKNVEQKFAAELQHFFPNHTLTKPAVSTEDRFKSLVSALEESAEDAGKPRWCLKDPRTTYYLNDYASRVRNGSFVILVRDPRAVCRSYLDQRGFTVGRPANWIAAAERWRTEIEMQLEFANANPETTLIVRYESLIEDFTETLQSICTHLGIPNEPALANYYRNSTDIGVHEGNANIMSAPSKSIAEKWKEALTERQISTVESIAKDLMLTLDYPAIKPHRPIKATHKWIAKLHDRVSREVRWQKHKWLRAQ